jgi:eukaryotic-like serine/threonine-protein kinase
MAGDVIAGRYRLLEPLGRGAMSSVWLAHDSELDRRVAVKTLAPTADRARFEREARAVAALAHPNICGLYDYGESDGKPYMVLECLGGGSLEDRLARGVPLADAETQRIATDLAAGLAHAHERGLVHRDLKPANVLFDGEGRAKIADFGIARMGDAGTLTEAGTVLGTAAYISPEQASGLPATAASDVYSFGVLLFRMLTGRLPFIADNAMELVRMNRDDVPPAVASIRPDAPPHLAWTADAALQKDPALRPANGDALLAALGDGAAAAQVLPRPRPARGRRPGILLPLLVVAAALLAGGAALALALTAGGGDSSGGGGPTASLSLPSVPTVASSSGGATTTATTAQTSTSASTTARTATTTPATTHRATTTAPRTTTARPATTAPAPPPPPPTTTSPPPPPTTDTTATDTTATTTAAVTTAP